MQTLQHLILTTPQKNIIDCIYKGVNKLGIDKNTKEEISILEPSAGTGKFLHYANKYLNNYKFDAVEKDDLASSILEKLYPNQAIHKSKEFEKAIFAHKFDLVVSNPPFGQINVFDPSIGESYSIHNFFMIKQMELLKDKGINAVIISSHFMDNKTSDARERIAKSGAFLGGVRLPNNIFKNTDVETDILFFQKDGDRALNKEFIHSNYHLPKTYDENGEEVANEKYINEYFKNNPQNILGRYEIRSSQFGKEYQCVMDESIDVFKEINRFIENELPKNIFEYKKEELDLEILKTNVNEINESSIKYLNNLKNNQLLLVNDEIYTFNNKIKDDYYFKKFNPKNKTEKEKIISLIGLRDVYNDLLKKESQIVDENDSTLIYLRGELNRSYDEFIKKYGYLNSSKNNKLLDDDIDNPKILSLENKYYKAISEKKAKELGIKPRGEKAIKADIFNKKILNPNIEIEIKTPKDALLYSLMQKGKIDIDLMIKQSKIDEKELIDDLLAQNLIFLDPKSVNEAKKEYILADLYLSGNIKEKIDEVKPLIEEYPELKTNLDKLNETMPKRLEAKDIKVEFGMTWIPSKYYKEFLANELEIDEDQIKIGFDKDLGRWRFALSGYIGSYEARQNYSNEKVSIAKLIDSALSKDPIRCYTQIDTNTKVLDETNTSDAKIKTEKLRDKFSDWIYKEHGRRKNLENIYNDTMNNYVTPSLNGDHINPVGFNKDIKLMKHQKDAIYRSIQTRSLLLEHQVGAGKTLTTIVSLMEQKRLGIINKPLVIVPKSLIGQWSSEFYKAYPNANILSAKEDDLSPKGREIFFQKIVNNNYDAIIMTHEQFNKIPAPRSAIEEALADQIKIAEKKLSNAKEFKEFDSGRRFSFVKEQEKIENLKTKYQILQDNKSKSVDFSDLGIDMLVVDEAHLFKNLDLNTYLRGYKGLGAEGGSKKAEDLHLKTSYLHKNNKKVMFLSGTPMSNSIVEIYVMQKYLQPELLKEKGLDSFGAWINNFGKQTSDYELDTSGTSYKLVSRFSSFQNVAELSTMYRMNADVITNSDILKFKKNFVPELQNGKPKNIVSKRSKLMGEFIEEIIYRMEHIRENPRENNPLKCTSDARKIALDQRIVFEDADDYEESKANLLVKEVKKEYDLYEKEKGTQIIFCDLSTPKRHSSLVATKKNSNAYYEGIITFKDNFTTFMVRDNSLYAISPDAEVFNLTDKLADLYSEFVSDKDSLKSPTIKCADRIHDEFMQIGFIRDKEGDNIKLMSKDWQGNEIEISDKILLNPNDFLDEKYLFIKDNKLDYKDNFQPFLELEVRDNNVFVELLSSDYPGKVEESSFNLTQEIKKLENRIKKTPLEIIDKNLIVKDADEREFEINLKNVDGELKVTLANVEFDKDLFVPDIHLKKTNINYKLFENNVDLNDIINTEEIKELSEDEKIAKSVKFDVYSDVLSKLVNAGIKKEEIAFIHDAKSDTEKKALFNSVNEGKIRILLGSTSKMGAGVNIQERVTAIHHLDCPWRPSDLEQRNGRVIRQGNKLFEKDPKNFKIKEFRYATELTYDAKMWQIIETKAKAIEQFKKGDPNLREIDDISLGSADAAEMKAVASGNPLIQKQIELKKELREEELKYKVFINTNMSNEDKFKVAEFKLNEAREELEVLNILKNASKDQDSFKIAIFDENGVKKEFNISQDELKTQNELRGLFSKKIEQVVEEQAEMPVLEYKGILIKAQSIFNKLGRESNFILTTSENENKCLEPENLIYNRRDPLFHQSDDIKFNGLLQKINNFVNRIDEKIENKEKDILEFSKDKEYYEDKLKNTGEFKNKELIEALREDIITLDNEISRKNQDLSIVLRSDIIKARLKSKAISPTLFDKVEKMEIGEDRGDDICY